MQKEHKKASKKKKLKRLLIILLICIILVVLRFIINGLFNLSLHRYISTFDSVDYSGENRHLPEFDSNTGHYSFTCDENDLRIMFLTDIHLGAGPYTHKTDRKSIYEIMTMLNEVKPDLVILGGDNIFATPGPIFNGGGTFNNKMASKTVIKIFEQAGVYFTTVFGNHDAESFDYTSRQALARLYENDSFRYCLFQSEFTDPEDSMPSVTNQVITVKNTEGEIIDLLLMIDSNSYINKSIRSTIQWKYDTIHDAQVDWAESEIKRLTELDGKDKAIDTLAFFHIPVSEFQIALNDLKQNDFKDTLHSKYITGVWDETPNETFGNRIWYGGVSRYTSNIGIADRFYETLGPSGINALRAIICGHDHTNNGVVEYNGVLMAYGLSMDNNAYDDIAESGLQRGCSIITIKKDGSYSFVQKNAYTELGTDTNKFIDVYLDHYYYDDYEPSI